MRFTITELVQVDQYQGKFGPQEGYLAFATDEGGNVYAIKFSKKAGANIQPGSGVDLLETNERWTHGPDEFMVCKAMPMNAAGGGRDNSQRGNPYNGGGQRPSANAQPQRPQGPHGAGNAPQHHSREVPTVGQRLGLIHSLFPRCYKMAVAAVAGTDADPYKLAVSSVMNLVISLDRGEIRPDPSAADIEAAAKAKAAEAQRLAEEAERAKQAAADAAARAAGPAGYAPQDAPPLIDDTDIPF